MTNQIPRLFPHTGAKHFLLDRYLKSWFPIVASLPTNRVVYIDGFAGPGTYGGHRGSPLIALRALVDHQYYPRMQGKEFTFWFIEKSRTAMQELEQTVAALHLPAHITVHIERTTFADAIDETLSDLERHGATLAPTFAFIDPFGFSHTPLETIARFAQFPRTEVLITLQFEHLNRFLCVNNQRLQAHYTHLFGTEEWKRACRARRADHRRAFIHDLYQNQLQRAGFKFIRSFEMRDVRNRVEYYLFFCTNHELGLERMKEAMWAMDPSGQYTFSDHTAGRIVLFVDDPDPRPLARAIRREFRGQTVSIEEVDHLVVQRTAYLRKHRRPILIDWERRRILEIVDAPDRRRRSTFPPGTVVRIRR